MTVAPEADLFWALRGAGPNFGIITSAVMKSYPVTPVEQTAWLGELTYTSDKIEALVEAIDKLVLEAKMNIFLYYMTSGAPEYTPVVVATPFYYGTEAEGKVAFASLYAVGPSNDTTSVRPYIHWNDGSAGFCTKGGRKPAYGVGLAKMIPSTWRAVWNEYVEFLQNNGTGNSIIIMAAYSLTKARSIPGSSSSFPFRSDVNFNAVAITWYNDPSLDQKAVVLGTNARDLWRSTD